MNLLFPFGKDNVWELDSDTYQHLALNEIVEMIALTKEEKDIVKKIFTKMPLDTKTINYRLDIIRDLISCREFCEELKTILVKIDVLNEYNMHNHFHIEKRPSLWDLIDFMTEMDIYVEVVEALNSLFTKYPMESEGLREIANLLKEVINTDQISELKEVVKNLKADTTTVKSVTLAVNLTPELFPEEVQVLSYNKVPFKSKYVKDVWALSIQSASRVSYRVQTPFMKGVCDDLEKHLGRSLHEYKSELKKYVNFKGYFLLDICNDLKYYLLCARCAHHLIDSGYEICYPKIDSTLNHIEIKDVYNIRLANKKIDAKDIVKNDFSFTPSERIFILTGPNRGGKTILTQSVGINAFLASQGLFVCAKSYEGFNFTKILTHFPADENETLDLGRLGEEAIRVQKIAEVADDKTLVLLNETYSSTSAVDGLYLARDLVHVLKDNNVPTIFNTHIHELARGVSDMNKWDGADIVSITMEMVNNENTYRVLRKEPDSSSFAHNIALKYGVTYEQMKK